MYIHSVNNRRYSIFTIRYSLAAARRGISLMEVLASTFVIAVGLLGVLAVIPFGAFQVGKANNADHCANVLRGAVNEISVRGMAKPENWKAPVITGSGANAVSVISVRDNVSVDASTGTEIYRKVRDNGTPTNDCNWLNCSRIFIVDPFNAPGTPSVSNNIFQIGANFDRAAACQEAMRGQDDLQYTIPSDDKRTVLSTSASLPHYMSSGKYTWFFTFRPKETGTSVALNNVSPVSVDVLACFNRTPGDTEKERPVNITGWTSQLSGAQLTLSNSSASALAVENTKWILVTWPNTAPCTGCWCKIVSRGAVNGTGPYTRIVTVIGDLPSAAPATAQAFIVDGVLDHARIDNVPLY